MEETQTAVQKPNPIINWVARNHLPYTLSAIVIALSTLLFVQDFSLPELNKAAGWAAIAIISGVMLLGPLSRMWPKRFMKYLYMRKPAGLIGASVAFVHVVYSIYVFYNGDLALLFSFAPARLAVLFCIISTAILLLMSITSTQLAVKVMGYDKWKLLQTAGYAALALAVAHALYLNWRTGLVEVRPLGWVLAIVAFVALLARVIGKQNKK